MIFINPILAEITAKADKLIEEYSEEELVRAAIPMIALVHADRDETPRDQMIKGAAILFAGVRELDRQLAEAEAEDQEEEDNG